MIDGIDFEALATSGIDTLTQLELRQRAKECVDVSGWVQIADPAAAAALQKLGACLAVIACYSFGTRPRKYRGDRGPSRAWAFKTRLLPYVVLSMLAIACGDPHARSSALELDGKDPGKVWEEPYDPEPDAGGASPDAGDAASQVAPDAGADSAVAAPGDAQAPLGDAAAPNVDAGAPAPVTGAWRVTLTPVGTPCAPLAPFALRLLESEGAWTADLDLLGTLTGARVAELGGSLGEWRVKLSLQVAGLELAGELTRTGASCADRWTVRGVRP